MWQQDLTDWCSLGRGKQCRRRKQGKRDLLYLCFTDFSFQILVFSLKFTTSQEFKIKINCSKENDWRRKWQSTPVFSPGKSHGQRSLAGYSPRGCKESDTTERLNQQRNEEETGKEMTSFHILNKPNLILIGEGGLIHSRSDVMANE